ncbi:type II toxin-antitoxin system Phd/YefM family antitoxin [uncultured Friedmanniella sp.]|uniref:type II toxin-antitoxin system Phd/YefM family antitoxin n=1 Tax=uncultured Friedmanniella sp. TaxID=335381 RepID=UPI0035C9A355
MTTVAARDLRHRTAEVLRQVATGAEVTTTVNGAPVADLTAHRGPRQAYLRPVDLVAPIRHGQADPGLRADLDRLAGDTTDAGFDVIESVGGPSVLRR